MREYQNAVPRPCKLDDYICSADVKARMGEAITAARMRGQLPPHMLFTGRPGCGKTTAAMIVAHEMRLPVYKFLGTELQKPAQLRVLLGAPDCGAAVFVDEVHAVKRDMLELLYPIMEDRVMSAPGDPRIRLRLPPLVVLGATTELHEIPRPLRDRFTLHYDLPEYTPEQMLQIAQKQAQKMSKLVYGPEALNLVAEASKGTPRLSGQLIWQVNDWAMSRSLESVDQAAVREVLARAGIGAGGMDQVDRAVIRALVGGPMGVEALAATVGVNSALIKTEHEPYLIRKGLIRRTPRGREITEAGRVYAKEGI